MNFFLSLFLLIFDTILQWKPAITSFFSFNSTRSRTNILVLCILYMFTWNEMCASLRIFHWKSMVCELQPFQFISLKFVLFIIYSIFKMQKIIFLLPHTHILKHVHLNLVSLFEQNRSVQINEMFVMMRWWWCLCAWVHNCTSSPCSSP